MSALGFVGLGAMGLPMAVALRRAGTDVLAWNRSAAAREAAGAAGLRVTAELAEVGAECPTVLTMLPDLPQVRGVIDAGLLGDAVRTLVVMGTVSPVDVVTFAATLPGVAIVDAPVSGGVPGARGARLSIMVGGPPDAVEPLLPVLAHMGTPRWFGPLGNGSLAKACNQLVVGATLTALAEAVVLGGSGGIDVTQLLDALGSGLAASEVLTQKRERLISGDFTGDGAARYLTKDLGFVLAAAERADVHLPVGTAVHTLFTGLTAAGLGDLDNSVVLRWLRESSQ